MADKAFKILLLMKRKPGMSVEAFRDYYENHHVPLALNYPAANTRYIRRYLEPQPHAESGTNEELPYDVITELWFDDEEIFKSTVEYLSTTVMPDDVVNDELNLFDRPTMRIATVVECETDMSAQSAG
ncbi:MAG: EthD domain-containing protein [Novosphingobium sp.]|nr:EthD domain-containing protein [Novosphingobium sp.]